MRAFMRRNAGRQNARPSLGLRDTRRRQLCAAVLLSEVGDVVFTTARCCHAWHREHSHAYFDLRISGLHVGRYFPNDDSYRRVGIRILAVDKMASFWNAYYHVYD